MYQVETNSDVEGSKSLWAIGGVALLATLWGATFLLIKLLVAEIEPVTSSLYRCIIATLLLFGICRWQKQPLTALFQHLPTFAVMGFLGSALPFVTCAIAEQKIDSGLAGVIEGSTPLFAVVFGYLLGTQRKVSFHELVGVFLGFIGLLFLFNDTLLHFFSGEEGGFSHLFEELLLVVMAMSFALSFIYSKVSMAGISPLLGVTGQMFTGALFLAAWQSIFIGWQEIAVPSSYAILYQLILGTTTALSWLLYFHLIQRLSVTQVSFAAYFCPVVAMLLGVIVLDEAMTFSLLAGLCIIVAALLIASDIFSWADSSYRQLAKAAVERE